MILLTIHLEPCSDNYSGLFPGSLTCGFYKNLFSGLFDFVKEDMVIDSNIHSG